MIPFFKIDEKIENASDRAMLKCKNQFEKIEKIAEYNAMAENG